VSYDDSIIEELRARLQAVMKNDGFTQTDVAKTAGLSQSVVSRFLRGQMKEPPQDTMNRIRAFLGDEGHPDVLSHEEVRKAVRLYRYMKGVLDEGSRVIIQDKDGNEQILVFLW